MLENEMRSLTLLRASWVLPITYPPIRDGAVLVEGDRIVAVGESSKISYKTPLTRLEFPNGILMPGLVNPHTHLENTNFAQEIKLPQLFNKWLFHMVRLVRNQTFEDALRASENGVRQLVKFGVTCVGEFSHSGASFQALKETGLRAVVFKEFTCLQDSDVKVRLDELVRWLESAQQTSSLRVGLGPHAPYTVTPSAFKRIVKLARRRNLRLCVHAAESPSERKLVEQRKGTWRRWLGNILHNAPVGLSPILYLDWLEVLHPKALLVHCVQVDDADIDLLAERKVWVIHCPRSNANLKVGVMPLTRMLYKGVRVCLATDGLASVDSLSPLDEIRFAVKLGQEYPKLYLTLPSDLYLRIVTLDAAASIGFDSIIGSLEVGKQADITVFQLTSKTDEPYEALLDEAREAVLTMVAGRILHFAANAAPTHG